MFVYPPFFSIEKYLWWFLSLPFFTWSSAYSQKMYIYHFNVCRTTSTKKTADMKTWYDSASCYLIGWFFIYKCINESLLKKVDFFVCEEIEFLLIDVECGLSLGMRLWELADWRTEIDLFKKKITVSKNLKI